MRARAAMMVAEANALGRKISGDSVSEVKCNEAGRQFRVKHHLGGDLPIELPDATR
jgi:hypothetical protein